MLDEYIVYFICSVWEVRPVPPQSYRETQCDSVGTSRAWRSVPRRVRREGEGERSDAAAAAQKERQRDREREEGREVVVGVRSAMAQQPPDLSALLRGLSAPAGSGAPNPMAAMMQQMMGGGRGGGAPDMAAMMQQMAPMMQHMGPMMQQMAAGAGRGRPPSGAAPPNPMAAMMQNMMGGGGGGGGGGEPDFGALMGNMMQSMGPMIQTMRKNMERSQSAPHMQRQKSAAGPVLQLGPIEDCLAKIHAELLVLKCSPSDYSGFATSAEIEHARRLSIRRLIAGVHTGFAELRQMMLGLANLLKEPAYRSDASFRTKVGKLGEVVAAALKDLGVAIDASTESLLLSSTPAVSNAAGSDSDGFQSCDEDERAAPAFIPVPTSPPAPVLKKPGTAHPPSKAVLAAAQSSGDGWMKELPESERELWRSVIEADARRQATPAGRGQLQGQNRRRVSKVYHEMSLGNAKAKAKPSAIHTLMTNPEAMGGGSSASKASATAVPVPAPDITPMRGWHTKLAEGADKGEDGKTLSYEEQLAAQAKAARAARGTRGKRRKKTGCGAEPEPEVGPEHLGEID